MRTYAGDTSLPGGKWDPGDRSLEHTAVGVSNRLRVTLELMYMQRREAFEEVCVSAGTSF